MSYVKTSVGYRRRSKRSRLNKRRLFAFVSVITLATLAAWLWNDGRGGAADRRVTATIPAQRASQPPEPVWTASQEAKLQAALRAAFAPALEGAHGWSLAVLSPGGRVVYDDFARRAVAPASVQKLVVAATATHKFGAGNRKLLLQLDPKRWPTKLSLQTKALQPLRVVSSKTGPGANVGEITTGLFVSPLKSGAGSLGLLP